MALANTSRVSHRQRMHMAAWRSKETAEQWQQGTWRVIALKRLLFRQAPDGHETRRVSRLSEETAGSVGCQKRKRLAPVRGDHRARRARDQERAANRRAGEHAVSLEVEVGDFGVINPRKNFLCRGNTRKLTAAQRSFRDWCSG